ARYDAHTSRHETRLTPRVPTDVGTRRARERAQRGGGGEADRGNVDKDGRWQTGRESREPRGRFAHVQTHARTHVRTYVRMHARMHARTHAAVRAVRHETRLTPRVPTDVGTRRARERAQRGGGGEADRGNVDKDGRWQTGRESREPRGRFAHVQTHARTHVPGARTCGGARAIRATSAAFVGVLPPTDIDNDRVQGGAGGSGRCRRGWTSAKLPSRAAALPTRATAHERRRGTSGQAVAGGG
ncbi:hypothetical protein X777_05448, partial [Ooceraea biroi]